MNSHKECDRMFLERIRATCESMEPVFACGEMLHRVESLLEEGAGATLQRDVPWLTDVFFQGILAGERVQDGVRRALLARWREQSGAVAPEEAVASAVRTVDFSSDDPVVSGDRHLRLRPSVEWPESAAAFRAELEARLPELSGKTASLARAWLGRHGPLPLVPYHDWTEDERARVAAARAAEESALAANAARFLPGADAAQVKELRRRWNDFEAARDAAAIRRLDWLPVCDRERLANEIDSLEILYRTTVAVAYGMNRRGVGNVPALHVEGRQTRDGGRVGMAEDEADSANMVLDSLAMNAFLWFMGARERDGRNVCDFGPIRQYLEGPANARYLVGMVQDAVAGQRGRELRVAGAPKIEKTYADAPLGVEDGEDASRTLGDTFAAPASGHEDFDQARFFRNVVGKLAPRLMRYFSLVRGGMPKGDALRAVGATSAHFVEREARALLKELAKLDGPDFAALADMLQGLVKGA